MIENSKKDEIKPTSRKKMPAFHVVQDLRAFLLSEQIEWECEDGKKRWGVFIPYEENCAYVSERHAYINLYTAVIPRSERRKSKSGINQTHELWPYWTKDQTRTMNEMGYFRERIVLGWMKIMHYCSVGTRWERTKPNKEEK